MSTILDIANSITSNILAVEPSANVHYDILTEKSSNTPFPIYEINVVNIQKPDFGAGVSSLSSVQFQICAYYETTNSPTSLANLSERQAIADRLFQIVKPISLSYPITNINASYLETVSDAYGEGRKVNRVLLSFVLNDLR